MMKTLVHTGIAAAAVLALATGCSDDGGAGTTAADTVKSAQSQAPAKAPGRTAEAAEPTATDPVTSIDSSESDGSAAPEPAPTPVVDPPPNAGQVETGAPCLDPNSSAVQNAIAGVGLDPRGEAFVPGTSSGGTTPDCPALEWMEAKTAGGTAISPENMMLFHNGTFVRYGTPSPTALAWVIGSTDSSVTVNYSWIVGDETTAGAKGKAVVTFSWDGSTVVSDREVPAEAYGPQK